MERFTAAHPYEQWRVEVRKFKEGGKVKTDISKIKKIKDVSLTRDQANELNGHTENSKKLYVEKKVRKAKVEETKTED